MALTPMDTKTTAIFEVTPMHPTRNVTDKVLYKDNGKSYEVEMTATQAKAAAKTCKDIKIAVDGSYYPVTPATTDDAVVSAIAGEAPADVEAVEAGKRAFGSYFHSVKEDDEILGKGGSKAPRAYNLQGQQVRNGKKGIYVVNGKKIVVK